MALMNRQQRRNAMFSSPPHTSDAARIATGQIAAPPAWLGQSLPPVNYQFTSRSIILANCQIYVVSFGKPLYHTVGDNGLSFKYLCTRCLVRGVKVTGTWTYENVIDPVTGLMRKRYTTVQPFTITTSTDCECKEDPTPFLKYMNSGGKSEWWCYWNMRMFIRFLSHWLLTFLITQNSYFVGTDVPFEFLDGMQYTKMHAQELVKRFSFLTNKKEWRKDKSYRPLRHTKYVCPTCKRGMVIYKPLKSPGGKVEVCFFSHCWKKCRPIFDDNDAAGRILWNGGGSGK